MITVPRQFGKQTWSHGLALPRQSFLDRAIPFLRVRLYSAFRKLAVHLDRRLIQPQFNDRKIRRRRLKIIAQPKPGYLHFRLIQFVERLPEMDKHQIALMSYQGIKPGLARRILLHLRQHTTGLVDDLRFLCWTQQSPG